MSIQIYKNGASYTPTPLLNCSWNLYEPLVYTKDKMYSPTNLIGKDLIFSYSKTRNSYFTNSYWREGNGIFESHRYDSDFNGVIRSWCCCVPWKYGDGLFFSRYQNNFSHDVGVLSGNNPQFNTKYYDVYYDGTAQNGQICWPIHRLSNYTSRTLQTNAIVAVPYYFFSANKIQKTITWSKTNPGKINGINYSAVAVTATFTPPSYHLAIGYKGGNAVSANADTSKPGRIDLSKRSETDNRNHFLTSRQCGVNNGLSSLTSTVGKSTWAGGTIGGGENIYLGKYPENSYEYLFKVRGYIYLSSWCSTADWGGQSTAYVSAITPPAIGLNPGTWSTNNTWSIRGSISGCKYTTGAWRNFTANLDCSLASTGTSATCSDLLHYYVWNNTSDYRIRIMDMNWGI